MKKILAIVMVIAMMIPFLASASAEMEAFDERVSIQIPVYDRSVAGLPAVDDNYWTKWIQSEFGDKYNIDIKFVAIPRSDVVAKYNMLISGGDAPTVFMEYDFDKVAGWANDGALQPIDLDEFAKWAPTYYQNMVDNSRLSFSEYNGQTFFVSAERPLYQAEYKWVEFVRMDWLEQIGYDHVPANYEETLDVYAKLKEEGICEYPKTLSMTVSGNYDNYSTREVPFSEEDWAKYTSVSIPALPMKATEVALKRLNEQYAQGFINPEFTLDTTGDQAKTDFIAGKAFSYAAYMAANETYLLAFYENNENGKLAIVSPYDDFEEGVVEVPQLYCTTAYGMLVGFNKDATEDELHAAWMYLEWLSQPENLFTLQYGFEGKTFYYNEEGLPTMIADYAGEERVNYNDNKDMYCIVKEAKVVGTVEDTIRQLVPQGIPQDFSDGMIQAYNDKMSFFNNGWTYTYPAFSDPKVTSVENEYKASLVELFKVDYVKLITCDPAEFDALYAQLCEEYNAAGFAEIVDARLEAYENGMSTKLPETVINAKTTID